MRKLWKAFVVGLAVLLTTAPAATAQAGQWSEQARVTGDTSHGQTLAWFRNTLYVAAKGADNNRMYYTTRKADTGWLNQAPFPQNWLTDQRPALAVFQDRLYLSWKSHDSTFIFLASTGDGVNWTAPVAISSESSHGPALAEWNSRLYLAYRNNETGRIWLKDSPDGQNWGFPWPGKADTSAEPALASFHGKLFLFWKSATPNAHHYKYGTDREWDWSPQKDLPGTADQGPTAVEFDERLHVAWKTPSGGLQTSSTGDGDTWEAPTGINGGTTHGPALGVFYDQLYLTWKGKPGDTRMFYASRN
ncbi:MAG: hypothetical protein QOF58_7535 [Pseudonocardiales bacterium]|jgi:hypothetical protein|nr:hypothetical protein [Pseudonocardiales bacterium]